jgi:hypothetical protein
MARRIALAFVVVFLAACSGGGGSPAGITLTQPQSSTRQVSIALSIPQTTLAGNRRVPKYVSPSTAGLSISDMAHGAGATAFTATVDLSPTSSACTSTTNGRNCTFSINASVGSDDFTFITYDVVPSSPNFGTTAHELATTTVTVMIASGSNTINLALGGVVANVKLNLTQQSTFVFSAASSQVGISALDADSNIIIAGATTASNGVATQVDTYANPIVFTVMETAGSGHTKFTLNGGATTTSVTTTRSSDAVGLVYDGNAGPNYYATVTSSFVNAAGTTVTATTNLNTIYIQGAGVGYTQFNYFNASPVLNAPVSAGAYETITATETNSVGAFTATISNPGTTNCPHSSWVLGTSGFGASGSSFTINSGSNPTNGTGCLVALTDTFGASISISSVEGYTKLWVANSAGNLSNGSSAIGNILTFTTTPFSSSTSATTAISSIFSAYAVAFNPTTFELYVASKYENTVSEWLPSSYTSNGFSFPGGSNCTGGSPAGCEPDGLAFDSSGNLYVANYQEGCACGGNVNVFKVSTLASAATPTYTIALPSNVRGIADYVDSSNNLYVSTDNGVAIYSAASLATALGGGSLPSPTASFSVSGAEQLTMDNSGNLYVARSNGAIAVFTPPFSNSSTPSFSMSAGTAAWGVAFDPFGNLYVSTYGSASIKMFAPPFSSSSTPSVTNSSGSFVDPAGIVFGPV